MISIIITAFKEPKTVGKSIQAVLDNNLKQKYEILVVAPDRETLDVAKKYGKKSKNIHAIQDKGEGKSSALNLVVSKAKGDILVLTDGDVYISNASLGSLLGPFKDKKIGAVTGKPISINSKENMLGFWAYVLTSIADERRLNALKLKKRFFCSGYLFAIRKELFPKLPENLLSEDGYISHLVYEADYNIDYSPKSKVYVKYPTNFRDWVLQKKRSAGGYKQIKQILGVEIRSFKKESSGALGLFKYVRSFKQFLWLIDLFLVRIYLWFAISKDIDMKNKSHKDIWKRAQSTK